MKRISKKAAGAALAVAVALALALPALSFAQQTVPPSMTGLMDEATKSSIMAAEDVAADATNAEGTGSAEDAADINASNTEGSASDSAAIANGVPGTGSANSGQGAGGTTDSAPDGDAGQESGAQAGDCTATIRYLENPIEIEPGDVIEEDGRILLGTYTVTGLHEGDVLNAWNYVINIPGYFFFDGWPLNLTVSSDPAQNVVTLTYVRLSNSEYTVNYYVMDGADLTADNWADALKPEDVTFTKIASETFEDQLYDKLVEGDAYEYQVDGLYVIDTYPAEIRLGLDPDDNVINVLYTTSYTTGPGDTAIPDGTTTPDDAPMPDDTVVDKDDIIGALPDGSGPGSDIYDDFLGSTVRPGELVVTDEMLENPVDKDQATMTAKAYQTGLQQGSSLAQTGDTLPWIISAIAMGAVILALAIGILVLVRRNKKEVPTE